MSYQIFYFVLVLLASPAFSRNVPRFNELDEEDQHLFRAAYDTPAYDHEEYEEDDGKLDLVKDGLWALKAKIKELKAFDKALVANMLSTKLKVKDLLENHLGELIKHNHKKKPAYEYHEYQAPSYQAQYTAPHYGAPQYPAPQYGAPQYPAAQSGAPQYAAPQHGHDPYYGH